MSLNTVCWTDIPVKNLDRAISFYTAVLGCPVSKEGEGGLPLASCPTPSKMLPDVWWKWRITNPRRKGRWFIFRSKGGWMRPWPKPSEIKAKSLHRSTPSARRGFAPSLLIRKVTRSRSILTPSDARGAGEAGFSGEHGTIIALN